METIKDDSMLARVQLDAFVSRRRNKNWAFAKTKHVGRVGDWVAGGNRWVYGKCVGAYYTVNGQDRMFGDYMFRAYKNYHFIIEREDGSLVSALAWRGNKGRTEHFNQAMKQAKKEHRAAESLAGVAYRIMAGSK